MTPSLEAGSLHVWRVDVRRSPPGPLSAGERERAARFRFERDRRSFERTRGALRALAGAYLGLEPADVVLREGRNGKPETAGLSFNASHAGDVALLAFASGGRVGVDVEEMRPDVELRVLAERFFSERENEVLRGLEGDELVGGFYRCWTRKEAFVKATGEGLSFDLGRVEVSTGPIARVVSVDGLPAGEWTAFDVPVAGGYAAAVVCDLPGVALSVRDWEPAAARA